MTLTNMSDWRCTSDLPELRPGEIHVWRLSLDLDDEAMAAARSLLAPDECKQADRYVMEPPRRSYTACRGLLRTLLARYLGLAPREIAFEYGEHGKPDLVCTSPVHLTFNVSHSDGWALIGITREGRLGVDIERRRQLRDMDMVADTCFSAAELTAYLNAPPHEKSLAFYNGWTRKEAFIKALGKGLAFPLRDFDVTIDPAAQAQILRIVGDATDPSQWSLFGFEALEGYAGAVAIDRQDACWSALDGDEVLKSVMVAAAGKS